ncbi:uncharacterized protein PITG_18011 [Phytophthora infestans T30-4]|uniref:Autophagy-related protein n=2 Tax=Phytophthora infestans TaxID=4787 RepID=D0NXI1_PHYIT|nr:uncharacterized protein PITG_18011 [Phytophthora infestans T30-4]EEY67781.1 conserved hypothetical protein [Phytophthora infestans T30-4]KAF4128442.1 WD domain G-beta repeat domain-containing protein [Phytophthora infestans]KAI9997383.1 hypothetical protein PInf_001181 [Phytophthora infestans]|eukprot:XP_002997943.1 conserved hypothetical protein [Phytophthora infestans T30-4]
MSAMNLSREQQNELLFVGFNQDSGCFACGTDSGFKIFNCDPFKETFHRDFSNGGIGIVEMLFRCNILAIVGGGRNPRYPPNKVMIWDDHQSRNIGELSFRSEVKAVKLRRDRVVVVLQNKIYVYNFSDLKLVDHIETIANPKGLCALCPNPSNTVLACPGVTRGTVRIELYDLRKTTLITAHEAELSQICLNLDGTRLATASDKGTLIRIFDTQSGQITQELRRGADRAEIYSICFSPTAPLLACSSDKGTVHVFSLTAEGSGHSFSSDPTTMGNVPSQSMPSHFAAGSAPRSGEEDGTENSKSSLSFMRGLLPKYFSSEWSFAQFRVPETRTICAFGTEKNTIVVVGADGSFYKAVFDANGECQNTSYSKFIQSDEDE